MAIRVSPGKTSETIQFIEQKWHDFFPDQPFDINYFDDKIKSLYKAAVNFGNIISRFTILAIFIASLGLFGLSLFIAERSTKEIGIRKVFGASLMDILRIFTMDFVFLVFASVLISIPISWYFMDKWLQNFAYQVDLNTATFLLSGLAALIITLATISFQLVKAGLTNPIKTLRYE